MKIKVVMLDNDSKYLTKVSKALGISYNEKLELYIFTNKDQMLEAVNLDDMNVLLANKNLLDLKEVDSKKVSKAYLCESHEVDGIDGFPTVNKFQKIENIYEEINNLFINSIEDVVVNEKKFSGECKLVTYTSYCGGTGTSTVAVSEAISKAKRGMKVLYLNLEYFDTTDVYFDGKTNKTFSDVIFELKSSKENLPLKLESMLCQDSTGVYFYKPSQILLDKLEINNKDDIEKLFEALKGMNFEEIIVDRNINFTEEEQYIYELSDVVRFVVDGSKTSVHKFLKLMNSLALLDKRNETNICRKIEVINNKMSSTNNSTIQDKSIKVVATINKYKTSNDNMLINEIVSNGTLLEI